MSNLTIQALVTRLKPSKDLWRIKLIDSSRCLFEFQNENYSSLIYDIEDGEIKVDEQKECKVDFLSGGLISKKINKGDSFKLVLANEPIAEGVVTDIFIID